MAVAGFDLQGRQPPAAFEEALFEFSVAPGQLGAVQGDFLHDVIITGRANLYHVRMFLGRFRLAVVAVAGLALSGVCAWAQSATDESSSAESPRNKPMLCLPRTDGEGWVCQEDDGRRPTLSPKVERSNVSTVRSAPPRVEVTGEREPRDSSGRGLERAVPQDTETDNRAGGPGLAQATGQERPSVDEASSARATIGTDSKRFGYGNDPTLWFQAAAPRPISAEHGSKPDLAAAYYVAGAGSGANVGQGRCEGRYVVREYPHPVTADPEVFPVVTAADALSSVVDQSVSLEGNVTIEQGNRLIMAPRAELNQDTMIAEFPEGMTLDQPGLIMQGGRASVDMNSDETVLTEVQFLLTDVGFRGNATQLNQTADGDLLLTDNRFTRCEPQNNGWTLNTRSLFIEEDEVFGTARNAVLKLKSVPVFYSPYLKFPVSDERVSGFLFPNFSYSDEDGFDASIPYYFNLAPNYDATVVPRYISERGAGAEAEFRYKSSWQESVFAGSLLPDDDLFNGSLDRDDFQELGGASVLGDFEPADRWLANVEHQGYVGPFRTLIDYTAASDRDYFRDLGSDLGLSSRRELERKGEIQYANDQFFARLWAQRFQRIDEIFVEEYQRLPELELVWRRELLGPVEFSLGAKWSDFDRDTEGLNGLAAVTGSRLHLEPRIRVPFTWPFGFLSFGGGLRHTSYDLEQDRGARGLELEDNNPERSIGLAHVDGGLFFERDLNWFDTPLIQTLEPRVYLLWQDFEDQTGLPRFDSSQLTFNYSQLYRDNRFSGIDRIGDTQQMSAGVTTRFISAENGREYFRFSLGEIFYFDDRRVSLYDRATPDLRQSSSAFASEMTARLAESWRIYGNLVWDPHDNEVDEGGAGIQYRRDNRRIINLGFRNNRQSNVEQSDVSLYWPLSDRFAILGRWNYDLVSGRTIEGFGGLEYEDCCLQVRLVARRFLDSRSENFAEIEGDDGVFLQIVFKGLAGFGTKVESVLERGIRGYRSPQQRDYFSNY